MTSKTLITSAAFAALLAATAFTAAEAQTREAREPAARGQTEATHIDDLIIGARAAEAQRRGVAVRNPASRDAPSGDEDGEGITPHYTSLDDLLAADGAATETAPGVEPDVIGAQDAEPPAADQATVILRRNRLPNKILQRRVRAQDETPAALLLPAVQSAREAARRHCASSAAGGVADGTDTDSDGCANTAGQEGGGLWNSTGGNAAASGGASFQGGGGVFNNGGTAPQAYPSSEGIDVIDPILYAADTAAETGDALEDCEQAATQTQTARDRHDNWITLDSVQLAARCASRVRRGMQDLKN